MAPTILMGLFVISSLCFVPTSQASGAEPDYLVVATLKAGKELNLENPTKRGTVSFDCGAFSLSSELGLIDKIVPTKDGHIEIAFNNGDHLTAEQVKGEIEYTSDFGRSKLDLSSVQGLTTAKDGNREKQLGHFNRGTYKYATKLIFKNGMTRVALLDYRDMEIDASYAGMDAIVRPARGPLVFDWSKMTVACVGEKGTTLTLPLKERPQKAKLSWVGGIEGDLGVNTDVGTLVFSWSCLRECQPVDPEKVCPLSRPHLPTYPRRR